MFVFHIELKSHLASHRNTFSFGCNKVLIKFSLIVEDEAGNSPCTYPFSKKNSPGSSGVGYLIILHVDLELSLRSMRSLYGYCSETFKRWRDRKIG